MAGKLCFGSTYNNAGAGNLRESKSFCEGVSYRAKGTELTNPITDNPHVTGSEAADAWDAGWNAANDEAGNATSIGCCAATGIIGEAAP